MKQISVIGSIIFLLYVNDMNSTGKSKYSTPYVDETSVVESADSTEALQKKWGSQKN